MFIFPQIFENLFFSNTHNGKAYLVLTTAMYIKTLKPYTLAGFEPILSSGGGRDGHYAAPPGFLF
jgi:hypothetical protein